MPKSANTKKAAKSNKLITKGVSRANADHIAGGIVDSLLARSAKRDERVAVVHPKGASAAPSIWDTSKGRKWVVVAFWGAETTVTFHRDADEAHEAYEEATINGADAFYAKTSRMMMRTDPIGDERTK